MELVDVYDNKLKFDCSAHVRKSGVLVVPKKFGNRLMKFLKKHSLLAKGMSGNNDAGELTIELEDWVW